MEYFVDLCMQLSDKQMFRVQFLKSKKVCNILITSRYINFISSKYQRKELLNRANVKRNEEWIVESIGLIVIDQVENS